MATTILATFEFFRSLSIFTTPQIQSQKQRAVPLAPTVVTIFRFQSFAFRQRHVVSLLRCLDLFCREMEIPGSCVNYVYCDGLAGCSSKQASETSHSIQSDLIRNACYQFFKRGSQKFLTLPLNSKKEIVTLPPAIGKKIVTLPTSIQSYFLKHYCPELNCPVR